MADYIYLLENRLSLAQQQALQLVREVSRAKGMNVFLAGGAVRDLTSGSPVRDLDVSVQGNALKLKKDLEKVGGTLSGEQDAQQTLFFKFPGGVRVEISSTRIERYPKPGKPVYQPADLKQDLYRRDFTVNAMALSLNDGSYGLLIDPMNGVADIEGRFLRLVSNYGFIEDPSRLIRAARLAARLGWNMDEKTQARYRTAKEENYIASLGAYSRGYELEEIVHEEDPLKVLKALEAEGWMKVLFPVWTSAKANTAGLQELHDTLTRLQMQGVTPDASAGSFELLTAKLPPKDVGALKKLFPRQGFVREVDGLEAAAKEFAKLLLSKEALAPSATWKLLTSHPAEAVLWLAHTSKNPAVQSKFHHFFTVWPEARQKYPYLMMQEMRITPELPRYQELLQALFFEMMDGKLQTPEEMKAFLEPFSPPAPPPVVHVRRPRAIKKTEGKAPRRKAAKQAAPVAGVSLAASHDGEAVAAGTALATKSAEAHPALKAPEAKPVAKPIAKPAAPTAEVKAGSATGKTVSGKAVPAKSAPPALTAKPGARNAKAAADPMSGPAKKKPSPEKTAAKDLGKKGLAGKVLSTPTKRASAGGTTTKKTSAKANAAKPKAKATAKPVKVTAKKSSGKSGTSKSVSVKSVSVKSVSVKSGAAKSAGGKSAAVKSKVKAKPKTQPKAKSATSAGKKSSRPPQSKSGKGAAAKRKR